MTDSAFYNICKINLILQKYYSHTHESQKLNQAVSEILPADKQHIIKLEQVVQEIAEQVTDGMPFPRGVWFYSVGTSCGDNQEKQNYRRSIVL